MKITLFLFLLLISIFSLSQDKKFLLGFNIGPSVTKLRGEKYFDPVKNSYEKAQQIAVPRFVFGLTLEYEFNNKLSLISGVNFELKGGIISTPVFRTYRNYPDPPITYVRYKEEINYNLQYLTIPLLGSFKFGQKKSFFLNGGIFNGILLIREERTSDKTSPQPYKLSTSSAKRYDGGLSLGLGGITDLNQKLSFSFELRNNIGLVNTVKTSRYREEILKTSSFNMLIAFSWRIGMSKSVK